MQEERIVNEVGREHEMRDKRPILKEGGETSSFKMRRKLERSLRKRAKKLKTFVYRNG